MKPLSLLIILLLLSSPLIGQIKLKAELERVVDGDTFYASVYLPDLERGSYKDWKKVQAVRIRLHNCDTYELGSKVKHERTKAQKAKEVLHELLSDQEFNIVYWYKDHYGRLVCDVYTNEGCNACDQLRMGGLCTGKFEDGP